MFIRQVLCGSWGLVGIVGSMLSCCPPQENGEKSVATLPSARAPEPRATPSTSPTWPVRECESPAPCRMPNGQPGMRCSETEACFNPCPAGMGPEKEGSFCAKICKTASDCGGDRCSPEGICDRWPAPLPCQDPEFCTVSGDYGGFRCSPSSPCQSPCKKGLVLFGGTHCAKPCEKESQCPGGHCENGICAPLCPSEGCPYRWE
jgi:hypothetical protein